MKKLPMILKSKSKYYDRDGAVLPLVATCAAVLLILVAVTLNISWMSLARTESLAAADLASLSALQKYTDDGANVSAITTGRTLGAEVLQLNQVGLGKSPLQPNRIEFGLLEDESIHNPVFIENESDISSVRVTPDADFNLPLYLGGFVGTDSVHIAAGAVANQNPIEFVLCLDASRSMHRTPSGEFRDFNLPPSEGSRWFVLRDRVAEFLQNVEEQNDDIKVSLLTFGGGYSVDHLVPSALDDDPFRLEFPLQNVGKLRPKAIQLMEDYSLEPLGLGTYIFASLEKAIDVLEAGNSKADKTIVILSDGNQFVTPGETTSAPKVAAIRAAGLGITIHTVNFQTETNQQLTKVSDEANGLHFDASSESELGTAFDQLLEVFAIRIAD